MSRRPFIPLRWRAVVHPDGDAYWVELPDFPEQHDRARYADVPPEQLAANLLASAIIDRLGAHEDLPCPSDRQGSELFVLPRLWSAGEE